MITYIQTAGRDTTCCIWYSKIYSISTHDNLHSNNTQRNNMFYMIYYNIFNKYADNLHANSTQRDTTCFIWYTKIYLISLHDNLHLNCTQRHNMF
jgi:hypothetical protein